MTRTHLALLLVGLLLTATGIACWASGADLALAPLLRLHRGGALVPIAIGLSTVGGFGVAGPVALLVALLLALRRHVADAVWLVATIASGRLFVEALKLAVVRSRPDLIDRLQVVSSWSFPSSHSAGSMLTVLSLALLWRRPVALLPALLFGIAVGWSRLALGVHWPGDVLAGWGIALAWAALAARWLPPTDPLRSRSRS